MRGSGARAVAVKAAKGFTWFIFLKNRDNVARIVKSLENLGLLIDSIAEAIKDEIKNNKKMKYLLLWW